MTIELRFLDWLVNSGLAPVKFKSPHSDLVADGAIHRYRGDGDKSGAWNCWYTLSCLPTGHGAAGSWRTGVSLTWFDQVTKPATAAERQALRDRMQAIKRQRAEDQAKVYAEARTKADKLWRLAKPATEHHPYLITKKVRGWGIRQLRDQLIIPARDVDGQLHTLQLIGPDGGKKFLTGGRVRGCYYAIGRPDGVLLIAEGYATAASVYEATGQATAAAFNATNMVEVAQALRGKFGPGIKIVLAADDDHATPGNPGLTAAMRAAALVGGYVAKPDFSMVPT
jgi:putative DNA primase/helicase